MSLAEAIARALKYNYEIQLAQAEVNLQEKQLDLAMSQMLPKLAAGAGYNWRNIPNAAESIDVDHGAAVAGLVLFRGARIRRHGPDLDLERARSGRQLLPGQATGISPA